MDRFPPTSREGLLDKDIIGQLTTIKSSISDSSQGNDWFEGDHSNESINQLQRSWNTLTNSLIRMPFLFECHLWDQIYFDKETNAGEDYFYKWTLMLKIVRRHQRYELLRLVSRPISLLLQKLPRLPRRHVCTNGLSSRKHINVFAQFKRLSYEKFKSIYTKHSNPPYVFRKLYIEDVPEMDLNLSIQYLDKPHNIMLDLDLNKRNDKPMSEIQELSRTDVRNAMASTPILGLAAQNPQIYRKLKLQTLTVSAEGSYADGIYLYGIIMLCRGEGDIGQTLAWLERNHNKSGRTLEENLHGIIVTRLSVS
ncbi:LOW QUALITY PROTEIN: hypothetical protein YC2023_019999 [Brassica napus]